MYRTNSLISATGFFLFWIAVLYAGADHPPPRSFLWIVALVLVCSLVVYWRVPAYVHWIRTRRQGRRLHVVLDGLVAGYAVAALALLLRGGEPSVTPTLVDRAIWFAVLGAIGAANAWALYLANGLALRVAGRRVGRE